MKKILYIFLVSILTVLIVKIGYACYSKDSGFKVEIKGLKINIGKLEEFCKGADCASDEAFIAVKSRYDNRVELLIKKNAEENGLCMLVIKLPFTLDTKQNPVMGVIDPKKYNWVESTRKDLIFLKNAGILDITEAEIGKISGLSRPPRGIIYCKNKWQVAESAGCICLNNEIMCPEC